MQRTLLAVTLALTLAGTLAAQDVKVAVKLDKTTITAGETAEVEVSVSWHGAQDAYSIEQWDPPQVAGVELNAITDDVAVEMEPGKPTFRRRATYPIRGATPGTLSISPAKIALRGP